MKVRIGWKGSSVEVHPDIGPLVPGEVLERDLAPDLVEALRADGSGLYDIQDVVAPAAMASVSRRAHVAERGEEGT